jgi:hypothetical protein
MTYELNDANRIGMHYWFAADIGTQYNFEYNDSEPSNAPLSTSTILGAITGVPKLGSALYVAFVNEEVNAAWFGATDEPDDWGDGGGGGFTHTYSAVGSYWVTIGSPAQAARRVRVIYRTKPDGSYNPGDISYPVSIDPATEGNIQTGFALKCTITLDNYTEAEETYGVLYPRTLMGVFGQEHRGNGVHGDIKLIAGGWLESPTLDRSPGARKITFICYGPNYWQLNSYNREMYFIDPGVIGMALGLDASNQNLGNGALNYDITGQGYIANHWLKCQATVVAAHLLQHIHVYATDGGSPGEENATNPTMETCDGSDAFGTAGQFWDIYTDADFNEASGRTEAGFTDFSINAGQVLSNVRQLLDNEGWRYIDRHNLTQMFQRKPYYRSAQPTPTLDIPDVTELLDGYEVQVTPKFVKVVIVEKPPLAVISDATNTDAVGAGTMRDPLSIVHADIYPYTASQGGLVDGWNSAIGGSSFGGNNTVNDPLQSSLNTTDFYAQYPVTPRTFGQMIGPLKYIYSLSPTAYAQGRDKEERAAWTAVIPVGQVIGPGLGDIVTITDSSDELNYNWTAKGFDVISQRMMLVVDEFWQVFNGIEVDPDDQNNPGGVPTPSNLADVGDAAPGAMSLSWDASHGTSDVGIEIQIWNDTTQIYSQTTDGTSVVIFPTNSSVPTGLAAGTYSNVYLKLVKGSITKGPTNSISVVVS